jgi:hypothetical protein
MTSANCSAARGSPFPTCGRCHSGRQHRVGAGRAPALDAFRRDNLYSLDARISKTLAVTRANVSLDADVFNVLHANTTLAAQTNVASPTFQVISLNLSPRILRFGLRVTF